MARIRSINPDALKSEKLAAVTAEIERCYWRLATHCDDEGRAEDDPQIIAAYLFPRSDEINGPVVDGWLSRMQEVGLIVRYEVGGRRYLEVTRWKDYQKPNKPTPSKFPPPEGTPAPLPDNSRSGEGTLPVGVGEGENTTATEEPSLPRTRGTRIPLPFVVDEVMSAWVATECPGLDWDRETKQFVDHWKGAPGARGVKVDWPATWRKWMRTASQGTFR